VHVEAVGEIQTGQHRVAEIERQAAAIPSFHGHPGRADTDDAGERRVVKPARLVVCCPADAIALAQLEILLFRQLEPFALLGRRQLLRIEADLAAAIGEFDLAIGMHFENIVAARRQADVPCSAAADLQRMAGPVGRGIAQLLARHIDAFVNREVDGRSLDRALGHQSILDALIDDGAGGATGREQRGFIALG